MIDRENFIGPPFNFGECKEYELNATVKCDVFEPELNEAGEEVKRETRVVIRRRGNWANIHVSGIHVYSKSDVEDDTTRDKIRISFTYPEDWPEIVRRVRYFSCLCRVYDPFQGYGKSVPGIVKMEEDGSLTISPANYSYRVSEVEESEKFVKFVAHAGVKCLIGFTSFDITYKLNDGYTFGYR